MKNSENATIENATIENVIVETLTTEQIAESTKKAIEAKAKLSLNDRKQVLSSKENKSTFDYVKLANVTDKIENQTASKVYKNCIANKEVNNILGSSKIPTFNEFVKKLPVRDNKVFSNWDGYKTLAKFNVKNEITKKVTSQNKKEAKK